MAHLNRGAIMLTVFRMESSPWTAGNGTQAECPRPQETE